MKVEIFTFCEEATRNNLALTLSNTFDSWTAHRFPTTIPLCWLALRLRFSPGKQRCKVRLAFVGPDGSDVMSPLDKDIAVGSGQDRRLAASILMGLRNVEFPCPGDYRVELTVDGRPLSDLPFHVEQQRKSASSSLPDSGLN